MGSLSVQVKCPACGKGRGPSGGSCPECGYTLFVQCPNCGESGAILFQPCPDCDVVVSRPAPSGLKRYAKLGSITFGGTFAVTAVVSLLALDWLTKGILVVATLATLIITTLVIPHLKDSKGSKRLPGSRKLSP